MLRLILAIIIAFTLLTQPALAQRKGMVLIRDAEIEHYVRELATPMLRAAKLNPRSVNLALVQDPSLNAFVAGGQNIFLFTGLLRATDTPDQLQGVIAHETGHIAGGHLIRGMQAMKNASMQAIIGSLAALAAGILTGNGKVAVGALGGAQTFAQRDLMSYSRAQESAADTAAMSFLDQTGQKADGLLQFMEKLAGQEYVPQEQRSAYVRTHPLSKNRIKNISHHIQSNADKNTKLPARFYTAHKRMKAKLLGYLHPETALLRYTTKDPRPHARYARAIALYRKSQIERALPLINELLREEPNNPFFHELKGQVLFENSRIKPAIASYQKAVELLPDSAILRVAYAHALLENKDPKTLDEIIKQLTKAAQSEPHEPQTWRFLATAWHRKLNATKDNIYQGLVMYARAEESMSLGQKAALRYATGAASILPKKSPYWLRAQDIKLNSNDAVKDRKD